MYKLSWLAAPRRPITDWVLVVTVVHDDTDASTEK